MEFPLVSLGRFKDMRERAERAEQQVDRLIDAISGIETQVVTIPNSPDLTQLTELGDPPQEEKDLYELPPLVEESIRRRTSRGTPLEAKLIDEARTAIELLGPDFDEESYAEQISVGTRIEGWPL